MKSWQGTPTLFITKIAALITNHLVLYTYSDLEVAIRPWRNRGQHGVIRRFLDANECETDLQDLIVSVRLAIERYQVKNISDTNVYSLTISMIDSDIGDSTLVFKDKATLEQWETRINKLMSDLGSTESPP